MGEQLLQVHPGVRRPGRPVAVARPPRLGDRLEHQLPPAPAAPRLVPPRVQQPLRELLSGGVVLAHPARQGDLQPVGHAVLDQQERGGLPPGTGGHHVQQARARLLVAVAGEGGQDRGRHPVRRGRVEGGVLVQDRQEGRGVQPHPVGDVHVERRAVLDGPVPAGVLLKAPQQQAGGLLRRRPAGPQVRGAPAALEHPQRRGRFRDLEALTPPHARPRGSRQQRGLDVVEPPLERVGPADLLGGVEPHQPVQRAGASDRRDLVAHGGNVPLQRTRRGEHPLRPHQRRRDVAHDGPLPRRPAVVAATRNRTTAITSPTPKPRCRSSTTRTTGPPRPAWSPPRTGPARPPRPGRRGRARRAGRPGRARWGWRRRSPPDDPDPGPLGEPTRVARDRRPGGWRGRVGSRSGHEGGGRVCRRRICGRSRRR